MLTGSYAAIGYAYDNSDNEVRRSYYNRNGDLTWCQYGYAEVLKTYDERNNCIEERLLNVQGNPAIHSTGRYSILRRKVNEDGKVLSVTFYDTEDQPTTYNNNYAEVRYTYDLAGRQTSVSYYDRNGSLSANLRGYAKKTTAYDSLGNVTREAYYDVNDRLTNNAEGYAIALYDYDALGNRTGENYLNTLTLGVIPEGQEFANRKAEYDELGRLLNETYYNEFDRYAPGLLGKRPY